MNQTINIADLVEPKFKLGTAVFVITRGQTDKITNIRPANIDKIGYAVEIGRTREGTEYRKATLCYYERNGSTLYEGMLVASLDDLPEIDRAPRF